MKIHPPAVSIDSNNPFSSALYGREAFADSLTALLRATEQNLVVMVNAPWGEGKTTFARMWQAKLRSKDKQEIIYFDAFAADYFQDPFVCFSSEILEFTKKHFPKHQTKARADFKKSAIRVGAQVLGLTARVALRAATGTTFDEKTTEDVKQTVSSFVDGAAEIGEELIQKAIEDYTAEKDTLRAFKSNLKTLAATIREERGFPLTIVVDELDRCRPDFALGLLERIKHLFDVDGVCFVLLVNREQIESYIRTVYGDGVVASAYLLKFAQLFVDLPTRSAVLGPSPDRTDYLMTLAKHHSGGGTRLPHDFLKIGRPLVLHYEPSLREMERIVAILSISFTIAPTHLANWALLSLFAVLKVCRPHIYRDLRAEKFASADEFLEASDLKTLRAHEVDGSLYLQHELHAAVRCCFMSDAESEIFRIQSLNGSSSASNDPSVILGWTYKQRSPTMWRKQIRHLCSMLEQFSLEPT